ncbi:MAG TPA: cation:proton antiporter [Methylomirabilota bacterium]|nr:cation:proton antiporter [Methylomirabilota bacterium]
MPHNIDLILTLTGGLTAALLLGFITQKLKLSPIVGYLLAGIIVGPHSPGFVADPDIASQSAEIGVILLMFGVGLHFHLKDLMAVRNIAVPGAIGQIAAATVMGALATKLFGWSWAAGIVFGMAISVASTVVLTRVLSDNRDLHTPTGHSAIGWLIVEDLFTIVVLVLLPAIFGGAGHNGGAHTAAAGGESSLWGTLGVAMLKLGALILFTFTIGQKFIPKFLGYVARTGSRELFTLAVLVLALGIAVGAAKFFGASMALGAFLAGMIVGQSDFSARAASDALPMRDAFAVLFFVSVGMLFDPGAVREGWPLMLVTLAIVLVGKPLAAVLVVLALKKPLRLALSIAVALGQIGEFSFILATLAISMKIMPGEAMNALVVASIVSITLNPMLYHSVEPMVRWLEARNIVKAPEFVAPPPGAFQKDPTKDLVIVIGYGPVGRTVSRILADNSIQPIVIELNIDTVLALNVQGLQTIYGDATNPEILRSARIAEAAGLILSTSTPEAKNIIKTARELNPKVRILTRSTYLAETDELRKAGADGIFSSEGEVALSMADFLMAEMGATDEQIDRERERVRKDLFQTDHAAERDIDSQTPAKKS